MEMDALKDLMGNMMGKEIIVNKGKGVTNPFMSTTTKTFISTRRKVLQIKVPKTLLILLTSLFMKF